MKAHWTIAACHIDDNFAAATAVCGSMATSVTELLFLA